MTVALICAAVFGTVMVISAFIRQLMLSRDKKLNDEAQSRALTQEALELEKIRSQMQSYKRFDAHYQILGENKEAIKYLDTQIEGFLRSKTDLIERYGQITVKESGKIISQGVACPERKAACDKLRAEIDKEIASYSKEMEELQKRRAILLDAHTGFQNHLLEQEKVRNKNLDSIYKQHSALLEKVYLRHIGDTETVAVKTIEAGTISFKDMLMAPIQFLMQFFGGGGGAVPNVSFVQTRIEHVARAEVARTEKEINEVSPNDLSLHYQQRQEVPEEENATTTSVSLAL